MYGFHPKSKQDAPPPPPGTLGSGVAELGAGFLRDRRKQIDKAAGYANGGLVTGPGTGTSDDIETELPQGSYVLPADTTEALGLGFGPNSRGARLAAGLPDEPEQPVQEGFGFRPKSVPVNLSNGEYVIPPEQVEGFGAGFLNKVKDATHTPTTGPLTDAAKHVGGVGFLGVDTSRLFMADGGLVDDEKRRQNSFGDMAAASQDRNTTVVGGYNPPKAAVTPPAPSTPSMSEMANRYRTPSQQSTQADVRRVDNAIDRASGASPVPTPAPAPAPATDQGRALAGLEGVFKHSRNEYSDNPNGMGSMGTGRPSAQNDFAAESLANRYRAPAAAPAPGLGFGPGSELERREQASQNITPQTSGSGYGLLDAGVRDRRNAMMDVQQLKPGARAAYAGLVQRQEADAQRGFDGQQSAFDRTFRASESAAGRTFQAGQNEADRGLKREGLAADVANNQARLGLEERRVRLEENDPALAVARQVLALRDRVLNARNPQERAQAAQDLATVEGRNPQGNAPAGYRWAADGRSMEKIPGGPADQGQSKEAQKRATDSQDIFSIINEARPLLKGATNSLVGAGVDRVLGAYGISMPGAENAAKLKALQGALVMKMPRMEGPQSDKDTLLYREMAGQIGDPTVPAATREAAMKTIEDLNLKYLPTISSEADVANLPPGSWFKAPDGKVKRVPQ